MYFCVSNRSLRHIIMFFGIIRIFRLTFVVDFMRQMLQCNALCHKLDLHAKYVIYIFEVLYNVVVVGGFFFSKKKGDGVVFIGGSVERSNRRAVLL